jgi:hypothetical protein
MVAWGDAGGHDGPGDAGGRAPAPDPTNLPPQPRDDDAMHPARHLRRGQWGRPADPFAAWELPGGPTKPAAARAPSRAHGGTPAASDAREGGSRGSGGGGLGRPSHPGRRTTLIAVLGLAVAVGVASGAVALLAQSHPAAPNRPTAAVPAAPAGDGIGNLRMLSTSTGWAQRLDGGAVLHTTRGVQRWTAASPPSDGQNLAVAYVDAETAQVITVPSAAGSQTTVQSWGTKDGGATWGREGSFAVHGFNAAAGGALDFIDPEHGWYSQLEASAGFAGTALFRTVDGGFQWSEVAGSGSAAGAIPNGCDALTATFATASTGWITGTCLTVAAPLYVTRDGGLTWNAQTLPALPASPAGGTSFSPVFTSAESGTLLTENQSLTGVSTSLFATVDGGSSWLPRSTSIGSPVADDFLDADHGWLVTAGDGAAGATDLYATGDGGTTWTRLGAFPYVGLSLDFLTTNLGWATEDLSQQDGGPAYFVQTDDGGRTWRGVVPQLASPSPSP